MLRAKDMAAYIHVDDGLLLCDGKERPPACDGNGERCVDALVQRGFHIPPENFVRDGEVAKVLGYRPVRSPASL